MKQFVFLVLVTFSLLGNAQTKRTAVVKNKSLPTVAVTQKANQVDSFKIRVDSLLKDIDRLIEINNVFLNNLNRIAASKERYKMFQTENIYNLIKLDTKTGKVEQVQWSLNSTEEGTFLINNEDLSYGFNYDSGSFELYPTKNMYQFILLDKTDGRKWHIQWGHKRNDRWIRRIY